MKKSTILFLTIIMALAFIGLLYMQIVYMDNMVRMRNEHFSEAVKRSLYSVCAKLEQDETKYFLDEGFVSGSSLYSSNILSDNNINSGDKNKIFQQDGGSLSNSHKDAFRSMQEDLKGQYLYQRGLLNEIILSILSQSSDRPIEERADSAVVKRYLTFEFENNGLNIPFKFALVNRGGTVIYESHDYMPQTKDKVYTQTLFPNDPIYRMNYLKVYFPTKSEYIFSSINYMIPAFVLTFILLVVFVYTVIVAFRQKRLSEMKNDFINNMTHEFKTPISTISLAAQMLNDDSVRKSPSMLTHISTVINDETKRLRFQVEKVLQMSMFDKQKTILKIQELDANLAISNVVHTYNIKVEKYGGKITANLDAENALVNVDEMHFTNVIFNLLDNAVKYRNEDVPLLLNVTTRDIADERLEIAISDNGIGIKKEDLKKVFEKFYRVPTGNRHDVKGFGLGLAYVKKMVNEFKGDIRVESELGIGTKFIITLPLI